jgi:hypothetical protein
MPKTYENGETQGDTAAVASLKQTDSKVTSIRRAWEESARRPSLPAHLERIIRRRAFELYERRGCQDGHAEEDWAHAEAEILGTVLRKGKVA